MPLNSYLTPLKKRVEQVFTTELQGDGPSLKGESVQGGFILDLLCKKGHDLRAFLEAWALSIAKPLSLQTLSLPHHDFTELVLSSLPSSQERLSSLQQIIRILGTLLARLIDDLGTLPERRHLYLEQLLSPSKKELGLVIVLNSLHEYESFELRHIERAIQTLLHKSQLRKESFIVKQHEEHPLLMLYVEVEKVGGEEFTASELNLLKRLLPQELKESIESLLPALLIPRNDEEFYRNIITLSQELRFVSDLPQVMLSLDEQRPSSLRFSVILLRLVHENSLSLPQLLHNLPKTIRFIAEKTAHVGALRKRYIKEANLFFLEVESDRFLRKNSSIDLMKARQDIAKGLESAIGPFRDYNGGFLMKKKELLEAIKEGVDPEEGHDLLLDQLFYALTPSIMQAILTPSLGQTLFALFLTLLKKDSSEPYLTERATHPEGFILSLKSPCTDLSIKRRLVEYEKRWEQSFRIASSAVEVDGSLYTFLLYLNPTQEESGFFLKTFQEEVLQIGLEPVGSY